ncbi:unnamed protein product, partial [Laminaria digitata]
HVHIYNSTSRLQSTAVYVPVVYSSTAAFDARLTSSCLRQFAKCNLQFANPAFGVERCQDNGGFQGTGTLVRTAQLHLFNIFGDKLTLQQQLQYAAGTQKGLLFLYFSLLPHRAGHTQQDC